ncbi:MAG: prepilin-type N-terminal cleavage/methylation domain-containing protein [Myxococcota bacterium]|jgi:prepilin-type N-terminal cleavage/methylation domain-containing protein
MMRSQGTRLGGRRAGFTLIEVLIATALLGFSLLVMFGFHSQAVRSNMHARKMTDCTYLAQLQMERLMSLRWTEDDRPDSLTDDSADTTTVGSNTDEWPWLEHPDSAVQPDPVNAANSDSDTTLGQPIYYITWDVEDMDTDSTWMRMRVRCQYKDEAFSRWMGTTVSSYRFRD